MLVDVPGSRANLRSNIITGKQFDTFHCSRSYCFLFILEHSRIEGTERTCQERMVPCRPGT